jgi:hypothetical protein
MPWPDPDSELYRPSNCRMLTKLMPTFVDRGCHAVSVTDPYGRILGFLICSEVKITAELERTSEFKMHHFTILLQQLHLANLRCHSNSLTPVHIF